MLVNKLNMQHYVHSITDVTALQW